MRVLLIQHLRSVSQETGYMRTAYLEPLGLEYIAAAAEARGHAAKIESGHIDSDRLKGLLNDFLPDVIGFSVYSFSLQDNLERARIVKAHPVKPDRGVITVFGGHHPTACPEEAVADPWVDFAVVGEGEETFCDLLEVIESGGNPATVDGLVFRNGSDVVKTPPRKRIENIDAIPLPKRAATSLTQCKQHQITYPPPSKQRAVAQVAYSRGCPFSCSYCASVTSWGKQVVWRDPELVCDEMEKLVREYGTNSVYFSDLTFNANKSKVLEFCHTFKKRNLPLHWGGFFRLDLLDEEMLAALAGAKCVKLSIGIESPHHDFASQIKGEYNLKHGQSENVLKRANELGLILKAYIIIGFPEDTEERILSYPNHLLDHGFDDIRVGFATPFPGTQLHRRTRETGLFPDDIDWNDLTTELPVLTHPKLSRRQLIDLQKKIVRDFYISEEYADHVAKKISQFPYLRQSWQEYFEFLDSNGVFQKHRMESTALLRALEKSQVL